MHLAFRSALDCTYAGAFVCILHVGLRSTVHTQGHLIMMLTGGVTLGSPLVWFDVKVSEPELGLGVVCQLRGVVLLSKGERGVDSSRARRAPLSKGLAGWGLRSL